MQTAKEQKRSDPTFLGTVEGVTGPTVNVALHPDRISGISFVAGQGYRVGQVGSFVRVPMGYADLFGIVTTVGAGAVPANLSQSQPFGHRWLTVQLIGEGHRKGSFQRGISQFPTVGDAVHLVTMDDLRRIYGRPEEGQYVSVGHIASADAIPALVDVNRLVTRHSAVVGSTGSGKSTTVTALLDKLSDKTRYPSARILLFDLHGEYARAFRGRASIFRVNANPKRSEKELFVPYWALTFDELLEITLGDLGDVERGAVRQRIEDLKRESLGAKARKGVSEATLSVDSPVPFSLHRMWFEFHKLVYATYTAQGTAQTEATTAFEKDAEGNLIEPGDALQVVPPRYLSHTQASGTQKIYLAASSLNIRRPIDALASRLRDKRYDFLFSPGPWKPKLDGTVDLDLDKLIGSWIGNEPITILDVSGIPSGILNNLLGAMLRIIYDSLFWSRNLSEGARERPLLVVLEEAHAYLGSASGNRAATSVKRIVKEGRKYGIGAMVVSQRPSEIDATILSQCGTTIALRLSNSADRAQITASVTDNLEGLLSALPALRTGEAIIVGEAVHLPMRTLIAPPPSDRRPDSLDPKVYTDAEEPGGWNSKRAPEDYEEVVTLWRQQDPRSTRIKDSGE